MKNKHEILFKVGEDISMIWCDMYIQIMDKCLINGVLNEDYKWVSYNIINTYIQCGRINRHDKALLVNLLCISDNYPNRAMDEATKHLENFKEVTALYKKNQEYRDAFKYAAVTEAFNKKARKVVN